MKIVFYLVPADSIILAPEAKIIAATPLPLHHHQLQRCYCYHQQQQHGGDAVFAYCKLLLLHWQLRAESHFIHL